MAMRTLRLNETLVMSREEIGFEHVSVRIRRTPSGWTYEYYDVDTQGVTASCYVPYFDELRRPNRKSGERTSFVYELRVNESTELKGRLSGLPDGSLGKVFLRRVPGGWVYEYWNARSAVIMSSACFVPMRQQEERREFRERRTHHVPNERREPKPSGNGLEHHSSERGIWGGKLWEG
jgi:hypothetical protein